MRIAQSLKNRLELGGFKDYHDQNIIMHWRQESRFTLGAKIPRVLIFVY